MQLIHPQCAALERFCFLASVGRADVCLPRDEKQRLTGSQNAGRREGAQPLVKGLGRILTLFQPSPRPSVPVPMRLYGARPQLLTTDTAQPGQSCRLMSCPIQPCAWGCPTPWLGSPSPCSPTCTTKPETPFHSPAGGCSCPHAGTPPYPTAAELRWHHPPSCLSNLELSTTLQNTSDTRAMRRGGHTTPGTPARGQRD